VSPNRAAETGTCGCRRRAAQGPPATLAVLAVLAAGLALAAPADSPPWLRRGERVEARQAAHRERLRLVHDALRARLEANAPDLLPVLAKASPAPVRQGYQIVPRLVPDVPRPATRPAARPASYSWPWTEQMIERDAGKLDRLEAALNAVPARPPAEQRAAYDALVADCTGLVQSARTIDAHIQYARLWQPAIAAARATYDRQTVLEHAVLERQAIRDALASTDEAAFRQAVARVPRTDGSGGRDAIERELRERETAISGEVDDATGGVAAPGFIRVEQPREHLRVVRVPFYTDVEDRAFVHAFRRAVESVWRVRDGADSFRVRVGISFVPARRLYGDRPPPRAGDQIDLGTHAARFPAGGGVLTTGANSTHVTAGRCIAVGPHDIAPHALAHEFGHVLGFKDVYFRGYRDLGEDGFEVTEVVADPDDIMGDPGSGPVLRRHFDRIIASRGGS
jgi:hypothetical protein